MALTVDEFLQKHHKTQGRTGTKDQQEFCGALAGALEVFLTEVRHWKHTQTTAEVLIKDLRALEAGL